jgi:hypothetical protein
MRYSTTLRVWQASGNVEGVFDPLAATWNFRFETPAFAEPLDDSDVRTLFDDMRMEGMRFFIGPGSPAPGYRWLLKDLTTDLFYLVEPASPRCYTTGVPHVEANALRLAEGPAGL